MKEITIPKKLQSLVQAFYAESEEVAKALIIQASRAIYRVDGDDDDFDFLRNKKENLTSDELQGVCTLMQGIQPVDMLEALLASQIVVAQMLGMRKLAKGSEEQRLGLKLLQFSKEAICHLQKKRSGGMQNITVNYNHVRVGPMPMQKEIEYAD